MRKVLICGSSLVAAGVSSVAGAVDVTLGGTIDMGWEYGAGKDMADANGFGISPGKHYQNITLAVAAAGTTDAGMKFGGGFNLSTAEELKLSFYTKDVNGNELASKQLVRLKNTAANQKLAGKAYNVSGGAAVTAGQIVSVKINSAWQAGLSSVTAHMIPAVALAAQKDVCKIAGIAAAEANPATVKRIISANTKVTQNIAVSAGNYLPAGELNAGTVTLTAQAIAAGGSAAAIVAKAPADDVGTANDADRYADEATKIYAGPFMEVKMTSSSTKMVVGAVCVSKEYVQSSTKAYLNAASRLVHVSDASVFIEGGFGKISLGTSPYKGTVQGVGKVGDQVEVANSGVVAQFSSVPFLGLSTNGAVDLGSVSLSSRPNYAVGTTVDIMGLKLGVEMEDEYIDSDAATAGMQNIYIDKWDAGIAWALEGASLALALDSASDWAMSATYDGVGIGFEAIVTNQAKGKNKKSGLNIDSTITTSVNMMQLSLGIDESLNWTLGADYSLAFESGLNLYATYSTEDKGGKMGVKMSF